MNFPYFIAKKVATNQSSDGKYAFSRLIIRIAIIAVALSVAVMVITTSILRGFKNEISEKIFGFFGHIHITDIQSAGSILESYPITIDQDFYPSLDTIQHIDYLDQYLLFGRPFGEYFSTRTKGGIRHIQTFAIKPGVIKTEETMEGIVLKGAGKDFDWHFLKQYLIRGEILTLPDTALSREIIISAQTADRLKKDIGDRLDLNFFAKGNIVRRRFDIIGIYKTGLDEYDRTFALADIRQVQRILGWTENQVGGFEVMIDYVDDINIISDYIYTQVLPNTMYAETIKEKQPNIFGWLELQNINEVVIIALMLVVSIINMMTALMILILERANMIGILKAMGTSNWQIRKIFLYYAAYIIMLGLFWGNVIGIGLSWLQYRFQFVKLSEADYYLSYAPIELNFWNILLLNLGTLGVILLFLIIPSYLVTKISPVQAIRFK
jgi:lipoprotein-releasing system permease protein